MWFWLKIIIIIIITEVYSAFRSEDTEALAEDTEALVKAVWCTKAVERIVRQGLESLKHRQFAEEKPQDGYNCPASRQWQTIHLSRSSEGPCAQPGGQAKKASVSSLHFAWNCHSLFKCIQKNNSPWSLAHMLQMTSCSAVVCSQPYLPSHSLINNVIVCNKSCYFSIINRKLYNK